MKQLLTENNLYYLDTKPDAIYQAAFDQDENQWKLTGTQTGHIVFVSKGEGINLPLGAIADFDFICTVTEATTLMIDLLEKWRQDWRDLADVTQALADRMTNQYMSAIETLALEKLVAEHLGERPVSKVVDSTS